MDSYALEVVTSLLRWYTDPKGKARRFTNYELLDAALDLWRDGVLTKEQAQRGHMGFRLSDQAIEVLDGFLYGVRIKEQTMYLNLLPLKLPEGRQETTAPAPAPPSLPVSSE